MVFEFQFKSTFKYFISWAKTNACPSPILVVCSTIHSYNLHTNILTYIYVIHLVIAVFMFMDCDLLLGKIRIIKEKHYKKEASTKASPADT